MCFGEGPSPGAGQWLGKSDLVLSFSHAGMQGDDCLDVSPYVEVCNNLEKVRFQEVFEFPEKRCGRFFMGNGLIPEAVQVKFEGLEFHDEARWPITEMDRGEVRIARPGTKTGEFRIGYADFDRRH